MDDSRADAEATSDDLRTNGL